MSTEPTEVAARLIVEKWKIRWPQRLADEPRLVGGLATYTDLESLIRAAIDTAIEAERERCAGIVTTAFDSFFGKTENVLLKEILTNIREGKPQ